MGDFLRARRELTTPEQVGIVPGGTRRRTPGLRREEVALLAGVSIDYYIRLEQGRERRPSDQVLQAIARALRLDAEATEHLYELARPRCHRREEYERSEPDARVDANLVRLMEAWDAVAAYVVNPRLDVLVRNAVARGLYEGLEHSDNLLRLAVLNPRAREFYLDWETDTRRKIAHLRAAAGPEGADPALDELVSELSQASEQFRRAWERHDVRSRTRAPVRFHHPVMGDLFTTMQVLSIDGSPGLKLVTFQAERGSPSECALAFLGRSALHAPGACRGGGRAGNGASAAGRLPRWPGLGLG
ncbi:transcriptional regulator [Sphaerisporangium melleum]|uniref:Transcriptional regulator n=1 Tax=Sphaerisporangium melleum TaxID=321316 RepID=A0A917RHL6_9ACTN|nr:transcriptional regulator [Sphaerisporangium melleum]GII74347.1 transcriptional regulator [Sphaerisporangium melleum]